MSRIRTRLERLEQIVDPCPGCPSRSPQVELVAIAQAGASTQPHLVCPNCGEPGERLRILVAFEPDAESQLEDG
jgi:hypothetical protein